MNILVVGSGGREHALAWKLEQSPLCTHVFVAPGNPGTANEANIKNVALAVEDIEGLVNFAKEQAIESCFGNHVHLRPAGPPAGSVCN